ncbi:hypothetical protein CWI37_0111p0030 [Hamiltosporidium tvaerminnensis]|uniref:Uncharacterized protein n=1 Tax=Hamiltosporidium tvaerminnensis TaxID=1176355 RepID=A0A4Q9LA19_9MICR|nr:hypothetical protein CWI37_0111p0030 [Hamiltosporidium tvaerminnensis]
MQSLRKKYDVFCIKISTEVQPIDEHIDEFKTIEIFSNVFAGDINCLYGNYSLYSIDKTRSEIYDAEDSCILKISMKTIINQYILGFRYGYQGNTDRNGILTRSRINFEFKSNNHKTEFHYFYSLKNMKDNDYKFKIFYKHSFVMFEFNFNWYTTQQNVKNHELNSPIYIYATLCEDFHIIEMERYIIRKYLRIQKQYGSNTTLADKYDVKMKYQTKFWI